MAHDHPPGADLLAAYAAGTLDPALQLLLDTQAWLRPDLAERLGMADVVSGELLELEAPAVMRKGALETVLARIDADQKGLPRATANSDDRRKPGQRTASDRHMRAVSAAGNALDELVRLPEPVRDLAFRAVERSGWRFAGPGIRSMRLNVRSSAEVGLLRLDPRAAAPRHTHRGTEYTLVLAGGFSDSRGSYGPGDLSIAGPKDLHSPVADEDGVCIALTVCDAPLAFRGLLGFIQRLAGG